MLLLSRPLDHFPLPPLVDQSSGKSMLLAGRETPSAENTGPDSINRSEALQTLSKTSTAHQPPKRTLRTLFSRACRYCTPTTNSATHHIPSYLIPSHPSQPHPTVPTHPLAHRSKKLIIKPRPCRISHEIAPRLNLVSHNPPLRSAQGKPAARSADQAQQRPWPVP
jgi:hypothetical protein